MTMLTGVAMVTQETVMADLNVGGVIATGMACRIDMTIGRTIPTVIDQSVISRDSSHPVYDNEHTRRNAATKLFFKFNH